MTSKFDQAMLHAGTISAALKSAPVRVPGRPAQATTGPWKPTDGPIDGDTIRPQGVSPKSGKAAVGNVINHHERSGKGVLAVGEEHATADPNKFADDQAMVAAIKGEALRSPDEGADTYCKRRGIPFRPLRPGK